MSRRVALSGGGTQGLGLCEFGHQGLYHDEELGLIYNRARELHPTLGRFMQRDPLGYVDGMGLYEYVRSGPVQRGDPSGRQLTYFSGYNGQPYYIKFNESIFVWDDVFRKDPDAGKPCKVPPTKLVSMRRTDVAPLPPNKVWALARMKLRIVYQGTPPKNERIRWTTCIRTPQTPGVTTKSESGVLPRYNDERYADFRMSAPPYFTSATVSFLSCECDEPGADPRRQGGKWKQYAYRVGVTYHWDGSTWTYPDLGFSEVWLDGLSTPDGNPLISTGGQP